MTLTGGVLESLAVAVKLKVPVAVGIPEIVPEAVEVAARVRPDGSAPLVTVQATGSVPPLALMVALNLFPSGVLQFLDSIRNGYWHARGPEFSDQRAVLIFEWLRMPADLIFIGAGVLPLSIATLRIWRRAAKPPQLDTAAGPR